MYASDSPRSEEERVQSLPIRQEWPDDKEKKLEQRTSLRDHDRSPTVRSEPLSYTKARSSGPDLVLPRLAELQEALERRLAQMDAKLDLVVAQSERSSHTHHSPRTPEYYNNILPVTRGRSGSNSDPGFSQFNSLNHIPSKHSSSMASRLSRRMSAAASQAARTESSAGFSEEAASHMQSYYSSDSNLCTFVDSVLERRWMNRSKCVQKLWTFLEEPDSSISAWLYMRAMLVFLFASVCFPVIRCFDPAPLTYVTGVVVDTVFDTVFLVEVLIRWMVCPSKYGFLRSPYNLLDLCVAVPWLARLCIDEASDVNFALLAVVPVLRLLKAMRSLPSLRLMYHVLRRSLGELTLPLFMLTALILVFSALIFVAEPRSNIYTLPHAMFLVVVTVSTVGYGDVVPITDAGRALCSIVAVIGVLYMVPLTIVGEAFAATWLHREQIVLVSMFRYRLMQWGFQSDHVLAMCMRFDTHNTGHLDLEDFTRLVLKMRLGLSARSTWKLFKTFDVDDAGAIDVYELLQQVYPRRRAFFLESRARQSVEGQQSMQTQLKISSYMDSTGLPKIRKLRHKVIPAQIGSA